jgi:hypothetical protein
VGWGLGATRPAPSVIGHQASAICLWLISESSSLKAPKQ